jgi:hypothetical protein
LVGNGHERTCALRWVSGLPAMMGFPYSTRGPRRSS